MTRLRNGEPMKKASNRIRTNGAYVIKSAESEPYQIVPRGPLNGHAPIVTAEDKKLAEAVWLRHRTV
jgi:hypothetical protein